jgi:hypothetical protein
MKGNGESDIRQVAKSKDFWIKLVSEGTNCLMRAISNALYFTETCHESIQKATLDYFAANVRKGAFELTLNNDSICLYPLSPFLPEFERINLQIVSRIYRVRICVYSREVELLYTVGGSGDSEGEIHIIRLGDAHYASLERLQRIPAFIFAQNFVLSIVENTIEKSGFQLQRYNKEHLVNFDYLNWRLNSGLREFNGNALPVAYRQNLFANNSADLDASNSLSDKGSGVNNSKDSVGSVIVSIMKARQKQTAHWKPSNSFEKKCEQFLNSSDYTNSLKEGYIDSSSNNSGEMAEQTKRRFKPESNKVDSDDGQ